VTVPLLSVEGVTKKFRALVAVKDVSFKMESGEILGLIGPNGAGKSTLFNMIAGKYRPDTGKITFKGVRIDRKKQYDICHLGISRTYQLVKPFLTETVYENALLAASFGRKEGDHHDVGADAFRAISLTGLEQSKSKFVGTLPFIDRRKVELARAIATGASLVLLDEPMAGLNPTEVAQFIEMVRKINTSWISVIIIEHVMHAVMGLSSRIIVLDHGEKIAEGTPQEVAKDATVSRVYLGE
jgi:branched-chain amino acid transport system ATP-binding protein